MPELAAIYAIGSALAGLLAAAFGYWSVRRPVSPRARLVNSRLESVALYWSDSQGRLVPRTPSCVADDQRAARRSAAVVGGFAFLLSWIGIGFVLLLFVSARYLARPRLERQLFSSRLAAPGELSPQDVRGILAEIDPRLSH